MKALKHTSNRQQGFTLIEIMVVVIIIGLLSALVRQPYLKIKQRHFKQRHEVISVKWVVS